MAAHCGTAIVPARPRKPRDKAKVEVAVQVVERWILARLRNRRFFSLAELNQAMAELLEDLNGRVTRHLGASRRQLFEELDRPALKSLPAEPYEYAEWKQRRAGLDYHVEVAKHYYSVPHALAKLKLWALCGQVDCARRETRTCRALPYVLVGHPNDMEKILVDVIVNTNNLHRRPFILFCILYIFNTFSLSGKNIIGDSARVGVTKAMTEDKDTS